MLDIGPAADPGSCSVGSVAAAILAERRAASAEALRSFRKLGDLVNTLRSRTEPGHWRAALAQCAASVGVHPSRLDDAARSAVILSDADNALLIAACANGRANITPCHIAELARAHPRSRREGINALLQIPFSVRKLRSYLRDAL